MCVSCSHDNKQGCHKKFWAVWPKSAFCIQATRKEQAAALLEVLLRKDNRAYISFYNALVRESYGDLASLLHPDLPLASPEGEKSFSDGGTSLGKRALMWLQGFVLVLAALVKRSSNTRDCFRMRLLHTHCCSLSGRSHGPHLVLLLIEKNSAFTTKGNPVVRPSCTVHKPVAADTGLLYLYTVMCIGDFKVLSFFVAVDASLSVCISCF